MKNWLCVLLLCLAACAPATVGQQFVPQPPVVASYAPARVSPESFGNVALAMQNATPAYGIVTLETSNCAAQDKTWPMERYSQPVPPNSSVTATQVAPCFADPTQFVRYTVGDIVYLKDLTCSVKMQPSAQNPNALDFLVTNGTYTGCVIQNQAPSSATLVFHYVHSTALLHFLIAHHAHPEIVKDLSGQRL